MHQDISLWTELHKGKNQKKKLHEGSDGQAQWRAQENKWSCF